MLESTWAIRSWSPAAGPAPASPGKAGAPLVAEVAGAVRQHELRPVDRPPEGAPQGERLPGEVLRCGVVAPVRARPRQVVQGARAAVGVPGGAVAGQGFLCQPVLGQSLCAQANWTAVSSAAVRRARGVGAGQGQHPVQPLRALVRVAAEPPQRPQHAGRAQRVGRVLPVVHQPTPRRAGCRARAPAGPARRPARARPAPARPPRPAPGSSAACRALDAPPPRRRRQLLAGVLAQRLQQRVARRRRPAASSAATSDLSTRRVSRSSTSSGRRPRRRRRRLGGLQRPAAGEDGEAARRAPAPAR